MRDDVTVICAVWHRQEDKETLLRGHLRNIEAARAARVIYVFDGGDRPPEWLQGPRVSSVSVNEPLSIYQAWNIALSMVTTALVMNLNVDDRLAPDAIDRMGAPLDADPEVFLVGGDWRICFTEAETDAVVPAHLPHQRLEPRVAGARRVVQVVHDEEAESAAVPRGGRGGHATGPKAG